MTFIAALLAELKADVARAFNLPAAAVYHGREPQKVQRLGFEVWIRHTGAEPAAHTCLHTLEVHLRMKSRREADQTGAEQASAMAEGLTQLRERYDGLRPFAAALPALVATEADVADVDHEPDDQDVLDGALRLRALERTP